MKRLQAVGWGGSSNTKLNDLGIFRVVRETENICHFGGPTGFELDLIETSATATAEKRYAFIQKRLSS